jgi:hypothetical protein
MANGCYGLKSVASNAFVRNNGNNYVADGEAPSQGEAFFMKAALLGQQMFYGTDTQLLTATGGGVNATTEITKDAVWNVEYHDDKEAYSFVSDTQDQSLIVANDGSLQLGTAANDNHLFQFAKTDKACVPFPEMPVAASGQTYKGQGIDKPVIGFAETHSHPGSTHEMIYPDGSTEVGVAGGSVYGAPFHPLGVTHALGNCEQSHGPDGTRDPGNIVRVTPAGSHDTQGWPTYIDWPDIDQYTHNAIYYRWMERAYLAGLRIFVSYGHNYQPLCEVGAIHQGAPDSDCNDHTLTIKMNEYTKVMQDYVDAQSGGPGKGWFRIVYSPAEAREVINDGKLAVILGMEGGELFECGIEFLPDGTGVPACDEDLLRANIQEAYDMGVRQVVPIHNIDNAFSGGSIVGSAHASSDALNLLNFWATNAFYKTVDCPDGGTEGYLVIGGGTLTGVPTSNDPATQILTDALPPQVPTYPNGVRQCNARKITPLGELALTTLMDKGIMISLDHTPMLNKETVLDLAERYDPPYPVVSGHGAQGGIQIKTAKRLLKAGGYYYPYKWDGAHHVEFMDIVRDIYDEAASEDASNMVPFGFGFGMDANGFGGHNPPRPNPEQLVEYPFTLFEGDDWGPRFDHIDPIVFDRISIPDGRTWDTEIDGSVHYGMVADFVEEIRLEGGAQALDDFYNSAEAYLQVWEKAYKGD